MRMTLGEMLKRFRMEKEIGAEQIYVGLCSRTMLSYYENGTSIPDILTFICFMERMGVSPDYFAIMVSKEEYRYFLWREQVWETIEEGKWEKLERLLKEEHVAPKNCNEKLAEQYEAYVKAIYLAVVEKNYKESVKLLENAINKTMPDIKQAIKSKILLGNMELHMLVLYLYYGRLGEVIDEEGGEGIFRQLEKYIGSDLLEIGEKVKIYPKLICVSSCVLKDSISADEQLQMYERAIELLRQNKNLYDITTVLQNYTALLYKTNNKKVKFYEKQYEVFSELFTQGGTDISFRPEILSIRTPKFYLINEYLYSKRKEKKVTQERVSEGICEPQTYSRVEKGTRAPAKKKFVALTGKLDIHWHYYRGELDTCELEALRLKKRQRWAEIESRYTESLEILQKLERVLDMENPVNYQYVKSAECMNLYLLHRLTPDETYQQLKLLLQLTKTMDMNTKHMVYYSQTELEIITDMAKMLRKMYRENEGIELLETVLRQMNRSAVKFEQQWNGVNYALRVLAGLHFSKKEYKTARDILQYVYRMDIRFRNGAALPNILDSLADSMEHIGKQYSEGYKKLYCQTYYVADFYNISNIKEGTDEYYRNKFEQDVCWYT